MGRVSNAAIKATAAQRARSSFVEWELVESSPAESDSKKAEASRQLATSNKKIETRCHNNAAHDSGKCMSRTDDAINFG